MPTTDSHLPRAASLMRATSLAQRSALRNAVTGTLSLVSLSTITAIPVPQLGWQPQLSWPQSACGPWVKSLQSLNVDMNEIGNQSRAGTPSPVWFFTSCARWDRSEEHTSELQSLRHLVCRLLLEKN